MLHMTLAANVLNAVGGSPALDRPDFIARYPTYLPHSANAFLVPLAPFSPDAVETFMKIEKPEEQDAPAEADGYETIGQFYRAIEDGVKVLCETLGETQVFCGDPARQMTPETFDYRGSGRIVPVYDLASALAAIDEIEEQGEGLKHAEVWDGDRDMFHPEREEVAHYFRFMEIKQGRSYQRGDTPASGPSGACLRGGLGRRVSDASEPAVAGLPWRQRDRREDRRVQPALFGPAARPAPRVQRRTGAVVPDGPGDAATEDAGAGTHADADRRRRDDGRAVVRVHAARGADAGAPTRPSASTCSRTVPTSSAVACRSTASRSSSRNCTSP